MTVLDEAEVPVIFCQIPPPPPPFILTKKKIVKWTIMENLERNRFL